MSATAPKSPRGPRVPLVARVPDPAPQPAAPQPTAANTGTPHLDAAVMLVQAAAPKLIANATGQVQSRTYGYVTNDAIVDAILPLLVEHELLWRTFPTTGPAGEPALRYRMTHVPTGEFDEDVMLLAVSRPGAQEQGSGITYAKRYSMVAYLNLTVDPDDDGAAASTNGGGSTPQPSAAGPKQSERPASANQRKMLRAKAGAASLTPGEFANALKASWGDEPGEWSDDAAAVRFTDRALDRLPARLVDAAIEQINSAGSRS